MAASSIASLNRIELGPGFPQVLDAAKLGEEWAWAAIYQAIAGPVTAFLRVSGSEQPLDLAGDVFFQIARSIQGFEGDESAFRTFVFVAAVRELKRAESRIGWRRSSLADTVLSELEESSHTELDEQMIGDVHAALDLLEREQRDILNLRIVAGLTVRETAAVVGKGVGAVALSQRKAMNRIRSLLDVAGGVS